MLELNVGVFTQPEVKHIACGACWDALLMGMWMLMKL